jgi:hypothetical protein
MRGGGAAERGILQPILVGPRAKIEATARASQRSAAQEKRCRRLEEILGSTEFKE